MLKGYKISKSFGGVKVLDNINLEFKSGNIISIFGGLAMILFLLIIQFLIGGLDNFFDDDLIFPFIVGASVSLMKFEKPIRTWKEFSEKHK